MENITEIDARLQEMKQAEKQMNDTRMKVLAQRQLEDADWYHQVEAHDAEEARLRDRKRHLSLTEAGGSKELQTGAPETASSPTAQSTRRASGRQGPRIGDPRFRFPDFFDAEGQPLWTRQSDGRQVYVMCPGDSCGKIDHKSIHGFLAHVRRAHPIDSILLGSGQTNAIEECAVLPEQLRLDDDGAASDHTSHVGREDAADLRVRNDDEELQIKEEPVEETGEAIGQALNDYEDDAELQIKLSVETTSRLQASIVSDTGNEHGKRGRSVSSDQGPSKRLQPEQIFPKRIERRY